MVSGQYGLLGVSVLYPVEWVFSLDTGSASMCSILKVGSLVWAPTERTKCAMQPLVIVSSLYI